MDKKIAKEVSWVKRGSQREGILPYIGDLETPTEISKKSKYSLNHTSRILNIFKDRGYVELLNPEDKTGRLYKMTKFGTQVRDAMFKDK